MTDRIHRRYQVFVSSTFQDLQDERQEVMQALLELDCIPAGMELFPAANQDQWTLIKRVIDDCDYYIVISAGRYGSLGPDGIGYTEMEYRYAIQQGKPVIGFLYRDLARLETGRSESSDVGKASLQTFRNLVQSKHVRYWESAAELGSQVSRSVVRLIRDEPAIGWIKASALPSEDTTRELLDLRKRIEELEGELSRARFSAPAGSERLAQGDDELIVRMRLPGHVFDSENDHDGRIRYGFSTTWSAVFSTVAPLMIHETSDLSFRRAVTEFIHSFGVGVLEEDEYVRTFDPAAVMWTLDESDFQTIKVQFRALGMIAKSTKPRSLKDTGTYWTLTPLGDETMTRLRAVKRGSTATDVASGR
jgi:hypothetical protein